MKTETRVQKAAVQILCSSFNRIKRVPAQKDSSNSFMQAVDIKIYVHELFFYSSKLFFISAQLS